MFFFLVLLLLLSFFLLFALAQFLVVFSRKKVKIQEIRDFFIDFFNIFWVWFLTFIILFRNKRPEVICKRDVIKNFIKIKAHVLEFVFDKVTGLKVCKLKFYNFIKK